MKKRKYLIPVLSLVAIISSNASSTAEDNKSIIKNDLIEQTDELNFVITNAERSEKFAYHSSHASHRSHSSHYSSHYSGW